MRGIRVGRGRALGLALAGAGVLAAAVVLGAPYGAPDALGRGEPAPRNVVVVMTDDQRFDDMKALSKTQRKIGDKGATFTESFASFPLCCPSRATYLTGRYAHNHGVVSNKPPDGGFEAFEGVGDALTTAVGLDAAGYRTGWTGKFMNGYQRRTKGDGPPYVPPGFDWWRAAARPGTMWDWRQVIGERTRKWGTKRRHYQTDVYARQAEKFIDSSVRQEQPFFLTVSSLAAHRESRPAAKHNPRPAPRHRGAFAGEPLPRSPSFNEADVSDKPSRISGLPRLDRQERRALRIQNRDRLESLLAVDDLVARVIRALRRGGILGDTLVIFTSDNGYQLGEHRRKGKNDFYDQSARVPLLMRGPGIVPGSEVASPVVNVDLAATIYDFTGVEPVQTQDGVSLLDVVADPAEFADREVPMENKRATAIRTPEWLYAEHETKLVTEYELYDLQADPDQLESLHDDPGHSGIRNQLAAALAQLRECEGSACH